MDSSYDWRPPAGFPASHRFAEVVTFSSYSTSRYDTWGREGIQRPYQIVVLPGYTVPATLETGYHDSMWVDGPVTAPTVVWDGFCLTAMFEVIYECMRYEGPGRFIKVYDTEAGEYVRDPRKPEILAARPARFKGFGNADQKPHREALDRWFTSHPHAATSYVHEPYNLDQLRDHTERRNLWVDRGMDVSKRDRMHDLFLRGRRSGEITLPYKHAPIRRTVAPGWRPKVGRQRTGDPGDIRELVAYFREGEPQKDDATPARPLLQRLFGRNMKRNPFS